MAVSRPISKAARTLWRIVVCICLAVLCSTAATAGTATLSWQKPTTNADGTPLTDLAGYKVYYGTSSGVYGNPVDIGIVTTYQVQGLTDGTRYYFTVTAYNAANVESDRATEVSKTLPASQYALSVAKAGTGSGSVTSSPAGITCGSTCSSTFSTGSAVTLTATPDASSNFTGWSGACSGTGTCSVTMDMARSVTATFALKTFTITATAGTNGSLSPLGATAVNYGTSKTFTITPGAGYHVTDVLVDGSSVGAITSYSFTNVTANHSITATFDVNTFTVTPSAGANGMISPSTPQTVSYNATTSFTVTPNSGYTIASVTGCGGTLSGSTYTTGPISANCAVSATFGSLAPNNLTVTRSGNGTVKSTPAGIDCGPVCESSYTGGTSVTLTASSASGWSFQGWSGACTGTGACTVMMNAAVSVTATFRDVDPPVLKVSSLPDGSVSGSKDLNVSGTATDNGGLQGLTINGVAVTVGNDTTFSYLVTLVDGKNTITTVATDLAGNKTSDIRSITLDQSAPTIVVTSPVDNSATASSVMTVSGTVSETSSVSVVLNSGTPQLASLNGTTFTATVILRSGLNTITVTGTDSVGNASSSVKRTVTYDDKKPAVSITEPPSDVTVARNSIAVQGKVVDSLTASTAAITVDGVTSAIALDGSGNFSATAAFSTEGMHTVSVEAKNQAGVSTNVQRNIRYAKLGDLNGSGTVDLADAVLAFRHITGERPITEDLIRKRCDVAPLGTDGKPHPDGVIDLGDVVIILRKVVGLVNW